MVCYQLQGLGEVLPLGLEHKAATSMTHFVKEMKRAQDNEADSFGIALTMRGKHNCTAGWVSLETHYTVETHTRTHPNAARIFPPIVIAGNTDSPNVTSNDFPLHSGLDALLHSCVAFT